MLFCPGFNFFFKKNLYSRSLHLGTLDSHSCMSKQLETGWKLANVFLAPFLISTQSTNLQLKMTELEHISNSTLFSFCKKMQGPVVLLLSFCIKAERLISLSCGENVEGDAVSDLGLRINVLSLFNLLQDGFALMQNWNSSTHEA